MRKHNELKKNTIIYSLGRIGSVLIALALLPIFLKHLPKEEFGLIGILWLIIPLISRLVNLGMDVGVSLKYFKLDHKELSSYLYNVIFSIALLALLLCGLGIWGIEWVAIFIDPMMDQVAFILLITVVWFSVYSTMMQSFLQLAGKATLNVITTILPSIIITVSTYILVIYVEKDYISYLKGLAIGHGFMGILGLFYFMRNFPIRYYHPSWSILKKLLRIGLPTIPGTVAGVLLASGDRYIIKHFLSLEAVAVYTFGYRFAEHLSSSMFQPFQKALFPIVLKKSATNYDESLEYNRRIIYSTMGTFPLIVAIVIIPMNWIMYVFGYGEYNQAYFIFLIASFGILLFNTAQINSFLINHLERTELNMITVLGAAILNILLNIWLIPIYGIIIAAFTTIISYLFLMVSRILIVNHIAKLNINLIKIFAMLIPFISYLLFIYYIDYTFAFSFIWGIFLLKLCIFAVLVYIMLSLFPETKRDISGIYRRTFTTRLVWIKK